MIVNNKVETYLEPVQVSGIFVAWQGEPWKPCHIWQKCNLTCDTPKGEPTGENKIPAILPNYPDSMLSLKIQLCHSRLGDVKDSNGNPLSEQDILNKISLLRSKWEKMTSEERRRAISQFSPGNILGNLLKPIMITLVVAGGVGAGLIWVLGRQAKEIPYEKLPLDKLRML